MPPTPQQHAQLAGFAVRLESCAHGAVGPVIAEACAALGVSAQTVHRWLKPHRDTDRKQRKDAGSTSVSRVEAELVAAVLSNGRRLNGKQNAALSDTVEILRESGMARLDRVDPQTGEIMALSNTTIARALTQYRLHPKQLLAPTPHQPLSSPHPNHTWQVDASVCIVFYLPDERIGMCELKEAEHYKNKPENLKAIERFRVIRYVATDHRSGTLRVRYYPHSESGEHTVMFLAWLMAPKPDKNDPFHGAPLQVMVDPGATSSGLVKRFCRRLGIRLIVNKPHNPRAKGQVEQGNNLWENKFEWKLKFQKHRVRNFEDLNALAAMYQLHFNATAIHSRTGKTRFAVWMEITSAQLRTTADAATLLQLATQAPTECTVRGDLTVRFMKREFRVNHLIEHGIAIKGKVPVHWHPFIADTAMAVMSDADGRELHIPLPEVLKDSGGFPTHAAVIGEEFKANPDTQVDTNRKALERLAAGADTQQAAGAARKAKNFEPFGGALNPFQAAETAPVVPFIPRAGTPLETGQAPVMVSRTVSVTRAALVLREQLGAAWRPEFFEFLQRRFAEGIAEDQLERLAAQWLSNGEVHDVAAG